MTEKTIVGRKFQITQNGEIYKVIEEQPGGYLTVENVATLLKDIIHKSEVDGVYYKWIE